jgi:hypothetical protein
VQEVVAADGEAVAVAAEGDDRQVRARHLQPLRHGEAAPVHAVEAVAVDIGGRRDEQPMPETSTVSSGPDHRLAALGNRIEHGVNDRSRDTRSA